MAAPKEITIESLTGTWKLDKDLSEGTNEMLALQGMNWVMRRAINMADVTIQTEHSRAINPHTTEEAEQIAITQTTNLNLGGTSEVRYLDRSNVAQADHIFGSTVVQSRYIGSSGHTEDGGVLPRVEVQSTIDDPKILQFLQGKLNMDSTPCAGFLVEPPEKSHLGITDEELGIWISITIRSQEPKWLAQQVWGFEMIDNQRRHVRRTVVSDIKGGYQFGRLVYTYISSSTE